MKLYITLAALVAVVAIPSAAIAENPTESVRVSARIQEFCEINAPDVFVGAGDGLVTGSVFESCNSQAGFQVVASHRPLEISEAAVFTYANEARTLHSGGWSMVANRVGAQYGARPISLRHSSLSSPLAINLTITTF